MPWLLAKLHINSQFYCTCIYIISITYSIKLDTIKQRWSIVLYFEGSQAIISKKYCVFSLKIEFVLTNSEDTNEMLCHLDFNCL